MGQPAKSDLVPPAFDPLGTGPAYKAKVCRLLEKTRLFSELGAADIEILGQYMDAYRAPAGTTLFAEGAQAGFMCILVEGRLEIFKDSGRGNSRRIAEIASGGSVGEMALLDGYPRSATAIALEPVLVLTLRRDDLARLTDGHPRVAALVLRRFAQVISQRLRNASGMLADYLE